MSWLLTEEELISFVEGEGLQKTSQTFQGVTTDSRKAAQNKVFFALKGPRFDGHDFLKQALEQGVTGFVVEKSYPVPNFLKTNHSIAIIQVQDTLEALQKLSICWRKKLNIKVLAITGSNGKTTTKYFTHTLLKSLPVYSHPKSYNNLWGVPLSILSVSQKNSFLIQEIGTSAPQELAPLVNLCEPFVSCVTGVGPSHLEGFGSLEKIAQEKQTIYTENPKGIWVFNRDNLHTEQMFQTLVSQQKTFTFSKTKKNVDVCLSFASQGQQTSQVEGFIGQVSSKSSCAFSGEHNLDNLMAACCLALSAGVSPQEIWKQIPHCQTPQGRQKWFSFEEKQISILFDAYNSNPSSMDFFLKTCENQGFKTKAFVLGDMKELGQKSEQHHRDLASSPSLIKSSFIWFIGEYGDLLEQELTKQGFQGNFFKSRIYDKKNLNLLKENLEKGSLLGIKASREFQLERLVFDLIGLQPFEEY